MKKKISFSSCFFSCDEYAVAAFPPLCLMRELCVSLRSLSLSLSLFALRVENMYTQCSMLYARYSPMNGETELKTYFCGDLKHNAVNYDSFLSHSLPVVFIRDFLFSRSFRYFFFSLSLRAISQVVI